MNILLVDDDQDDQALFCEAVRNINPSIQCEILNNGAEALDSLMHASKLPDVVFLDINMPVMDGRKCLKEIKSIEKLKNIQVVIYTTSSNADEISGLRGLGAEYIHKPNRFDEMIHAIAAFVTTDQKRSDLAYQLSGRPR